MQRIKLLFIATWVLGALTGAILAWAIFTGG